MKIQGIFSRKNRAFKALTNSYRAFIYCPHDLRHCLLKLFSKSIKIYLFISDGKLMYI